MRREDTGAVTDFIGFLLQGAGKNRQRFDVNISSSGQQIVCNICPFCGKLEFSAALKK